MHALKIKQISERELQLTWSDSHEGPIDLHQLRDSCPCAGCKGETVLFQTYTPPPPDTSNVQRYQLVGIEPVGSYALKFSWVDGHNLGLYTWEHVRSLCGCTECTALRLQK